jgi:replicative DNA helicase
MEIAVLGAMILDGVSSCEGVSKLAVGDFALDSHRRIFSAMIDLHSRGIDIDSSILLDEMIRRHELDAIGGAGYLSSLTDGIPRNPRTEEYVARVQERSLARRGAKAAEDALRRFNDRGESAQDICDDLVRIVSGERKQSGVRIGEVIGTAMQSLETSDARLIPTGIREIDEMTNGGMRTKQLWIVGANPSRGKSSLLRQFELGAINAGESTYTHTAEMPKEDWSLLHAAALARVPAWKIFNPRCLSDGERERLIQAAMKINKWPMVLDDDGDVGIEAVIAKSRLSAMRDGTRFVGVDYIQLIRGEGRDLRQQVGDIAKRLKQFAKKHDCCVVALSQLARKGDLNSRPTMQDLKESGELEAHADVIVMPYRPVNTDNGQFTGLDELIITKQRNGGIGAVPMTYNTENLRFESRRL